MGLIGIRMNWNGLECIGGTVIDQSLSERAKMDKNAMEWSRKNWNELYRNEPITTD
jgi:hypothetical protein